MANDKRVTQVKLRCRCGKKIRIPIAFAGQSGKCPKCGFEMQVPEYDALMRLKQQADQGRPETEPEMPSLPDAVDEEPAEREPVPDDVALDEPYPEDSDFDSRRTLDGNVPALREDATSLEDDSMLTRAIESARGDDDLNETADIESSEVGPDEAEAEDEGPESIDAIQADDSFSEEFFAEGIENLVEDGEPVPDEEPVAGEEPVASEPVEEEAVPVEEAIENDDAFDDEDDSFEAEEMAAELIESSILEAETGELTEPTTPYPGHPTDEAPPPRPPPAPARSEAEERSERILSLLRAGQDAEREDDLAAAIDRFGEALEADETLGSAWFYRGRCRLDRGEHDAGLADLGRAIDLGYRIDAARRLRIETLRHLGRKDELMAEIERSGSSLASDREVILAQKIELLGEAGDRSALLAALDELSSISAEPASAHNLRAVVLARGGDVDGARAALEAALAAEPDRPALHFNRAVLEMEAGRLEAAIEGFEKVVELDPTDGRAWTNLGICYRSRRPAEHRRAIECFRKVGR